MSDGKYILCYSVKTITNYMMEEEKIMLNLETCIVFFGYFAIGVLAGMLEKKQSKRRYFTTYFLLVSTTVTVFGVAINGIFRGLTS